MYRIFVFTQVLFFIPFFTIAQSEIKGRVIDQENNEPLVGANIVLVDSERGTITDPEGNFKIKVDLPSALKVSFVGYQTRVLDVKNTGPLTIRLKPENRLEGVVIEAIRADQNLPVAQTTIGRETIDREFYGQDALYILEEFTPSLITYSESGTDVSNYGQMRLRGIDQTRINITLNGVPLNDMIDQGVFFSNFTDFSNSIESVQVQRGVGTSSNGTASYAGSINFESINLEDTVPSAQVQLMGGSFNTWRASGEISTGLMDNDISVYTRFSKIQSDGYRDNTSTDSYSFFFSGGYRGEKDFIKVTGFTGRSKNGLAYLPVALSDIQDDPRTNYINQNDIDDFGQHLAQLQHTRWFSDQAALTSTLYIGGAGGDFPSGFFVSDSVFDSNTAEGYYLNERFSQVNFPLTNNHYGLMSNLNLNPARDLEIFGGIHAYTFRRQNFESIIPDDANPYYHENSFKNEFSAFGKISYQIGSWTLYGDLQFRTASLTIDPDETLLNAEPDISRNWTFLNPKVGFTYHLDQRQQLYGYFGRTGREPTKVDLLGGFQLNPSNLEQVKNTAVQPEFVNDLEAGYRYNGSGIRAQVNLFYMDFTNEIAPIGEFVPEGFLQLRKNMPKSTRSGLELDWKWNLTEAFSFSGNAAYMYSNIATYAPGSEADPVIYEDVKPALTPQWIGFGELSYSPRIWLQLAASARYQGESFLEPTNQSDLILPSSFVMDGRVSITPGNFWEFHFHFSNIFDQLYYNYGAPVDPDFDGINEPGYFVQAPRSIYSSLIFNF